MDSLLHALRTIDWAKLPPWLSITGIGIAYFGNRAVGKQRRIERRLVLVDRRMEVFNAALDLIGTVMTTGRVEIDEFQKFLWK